MRVRLNGRYILAAGDSIPLRLRHILIEAREHDLAIGEPRDTAQQLCHGRGTGADTRGHNKAGWRLPPPAFLNTVEQAVAPVRKINDAALCQFVRPLAEDELQQVERGIPMLGQSV